MIHLAHLYYFGSGNIRSFLDTNRLYIFLPHIIIFQTEFQYTDAINLSIDTWIRHLDNRPKEIAIFLMYLVTKIKFLIKLAIIAPYWQNIFLNEPHKYGEIFLHLISQIFVSRRPKAHPRSFLIKMIYSRHNTLRRKANYFTRSSHR